MDIFEIEEKQELRREEAAARLRAIADMLSRENEVRFEREGMTITAHVADVVQMKVELEIESDERELEIELKW